MSFFKNVFNCVLYRPTCVKNISEYAERTLNEIVKYINKTYADEKVFIRGSKYILHKILD